MRSPGVISARSTFHQFGRFMIVLSALAMVMAMTGMTAAWANPGGGADKVWVCKTVGDPKVEPIELSAGKNPIRISRNAVSIYDEDGTEYVSFNDKHGSAGFVVTDPADCDADGGDPTEVDTYCVEDGDGWKLETAPVGEAPEGATVTDDVDDCDPGVSTVWICDEVTGQAVQVPAGEVQEDAIVEGPGAFCGDETNNDVTYCVADGDGWALSDPTDPDDVPEDATITDDVTDCDDDGGETGGETGGEGGEGGETTTVEGGSQEAEFVQVLSGDVSAESEELPRTGGDPVTTFALALLMLAIGGSMITLGRRVESLN